MVSQRDDFDKKMCGKWKSDMVKIGRWVTQIFLYIEYKDGDIKVYFNFDWAMFNSPAFYVEIRYNSLYFSHNEMEYKYILTVDEKNNNKLKCSLTVKQRGFEGNIEFTRLSENEENKYSQEIKPKNLSRIEILREYAKYGKDNKDKSKINFEYRFDERENMLDIIEKNNLDELVDGKSDIQTATALMKWVCVRYKHGNPQGGLADPTPQALMEFADKNEGMTNCRGLSLILAQLIRAYNIKAFHLTCRPYEDPFDDCHVVVCIYCDSLSKWIMFDPTYNLYLKNKNGEIIGVKEFRNILIEGGELTANDEVGYHGEWNWKFTLDSYCEYMAKNLIRIDREIVARYGSDRDDGYVMLIPEKYMQNESKNFNEETQKHFITSKEDFWRV